VTDIIPSIFRIRDHLAISCNNVKFVSVFNTNHIDIKSCLTWVSDRVLARAQLNRIGVYKWTRGKKFSRAAVKRQTRDSNSLFKGVASLSRDVQQLRLISDMDRIAVLF